MKRTRGLLGVLVVLVMVVIVWGAVVRISGSGLSIPDWPLIGGSLLPPSDEEGWNMLQEAYRKDAIRLGNPSFPPYISSSDFKRMFWIEYLHRGLAARIGFLLIAFLIAGFRDFKSREVVKERGGIFIILLLAQAGLGGVVVKSGLHGILVGVHLLLAYLFLGTLIYTWKDLFLSSYPIKIFSGESSSAGLKALIWSISVLVSLLIQVFLGGLVAGFEAVRISQSWPKMFGSLLPISELLNNPVALIYFLHRWWGFVPLVFYLGLILSLRYQPLRKDLQALLMVGGGLYLLQVFLGICTVIIGGTPLLAGLHSAGGMLVFIVQVWIFHNLQHRPIVFPVSQSLKEIATNSFSS